MKKILSISALLLITISLISCSLTGSGKPEVTNFTGILTEQTPDDSYTGSHLLLDDAGKVITPLRSLTINLSNSEYLDNKVQILGKLNTADNVFEVTGLSVLEVVDKNKVKHELTEYKNMDLGFRLKYYSDWKVTEGGNIVTFTAPGEEGSSPDEIVITQSPFLYEAPVATEPVTPTVNDVDVNEQALKAYAEENNYSTTLKLIGPDRMNALEIDTPVKMTTLYVTDYFVYRNSYVYNLRFTPSATNPTVENKNIFNEMLSEFQFLPFGSGSTTTVTPDATTSSDTTTLDTTTPSDKGSTSTDTEIFTIDSSDTSSFESALYHFSAKYPADWYYSGTKGVETDIAHHYAFSDNAETESELIGLDIMKNGKPAGQPDAQTSGDTYTVYATVDGQTYKISGKKEYKNFIDTMAKSITPIQNSEIQ
jgi:hypothetical protein